MHTYFLQHVPFEGLGAIEPQLLRLGAQPIRVRLFAGDSLPEPSTPEALIVMGGPMGVHSEATYPWLTAEKRFLSQVLERDVPVLGVCLGAQLIADALGASVRPNPEPEIGWFPVDRHPLASRSAIGSTLPERITVLHWHGDTFTIPTGGVPLCASQACANQGFVVDERIVALQFHLETTPDAAQALVTNGADDLVAATYVQTPEQILAADAPYAENHAVLQRLLEQWLPA